MIKSNSFELNVSYSSNNDDSVIEQDDDEDVATIVVAVLALVAVLSFVAYVVSSASTHKAGVEEKYMDGERKERDVEASSAKDPEMGGLGQEVEMNELNPSAQKAYDGTIAVKHDGEVTL
jgi:ribonuclease PH